MIQPWNCPRSQICSACCGAVEASMQLCHIEQVRIKAQSKWNDVQSTFADTHDFIFFPLAVSSDAVLEIHRVTPTPMSRLR